MGVSPWVGQWALNSITGESPVRTAQRLGLATSPGPPRGGHQPGRQEGSRLSPVLWRKQGRADGSLGLPVDSELLVS